ncbi:MAG: S1/P1 nuclease [Luteimonas sp.]
MRCAIVPLVAALLLLTASRPAQAWSALGHRLVGDLAERHLQPTTRLAVQALLAGEPQPSLAGIADWADELRDRDPGYFRRTARWHYVNLGPDCRYDPPRDCPGGECIIAAIAAQRAILADRHADPARRLDALKFLVHLVADAHQPLHAGGRDDKGGNRFQVSLRTDLQAPPFARDRAPDGVIGTNLHAIWDYYLLATRRVPEARYADQLGGLPWPPAGTRVSAPAAWAVESCRVASDAYPNRHAMDHDYLDAHRPQAEQRIRLAAYRLAGLLDATLGTAAR